MSRPEQRPMSIDAMLDMERREVLALLESKQQGDPAPDQRRSSSPYLGSPRSPARILLDIEEEGPSDTRTTPAEQAPVRSMLDIDSPVTTTQLPVRSMLDLDAPSPPPLATHRSNPISPSLSPDLGLPSPQLMPPPHPRAMSDASMKGSGRPRNDPTAGYQFSGMIPRNTGKSKRGTKGAGGMLSPTSKSHGSKRLSGGAYGDPLRSPELGNLPLMQDSSNGGRLAGSSSKSPHGRWETRSRSPAPFPTLLPANKAMLNDGQVVDISSAYRRLSDANLAFSGGSLSQLPMRKRSVEMGEGRLVKDYLGPDGEHLESSDEDESYTSDDEDRGRKTAPRSLNPAASGDDDGLQSHSSSCPAERTTSSLLAAAEHERSEVASKQPAYQYKSLIPEPEIQITNSSGDTVRPSKGGGIHPNTSYDQGPASGAPSVIDSDEEADVDDIKRAQKLSFSMTNILTNPEGHRSIRIIYRGEYSKIVQQAEEEHNRLRKYLVATDLSDESTHALEWAIGTVLRDGDTLIAIYCVDEETGIVTSDASLVPDEHKAMKEQAVAINTVTNSKLAPAQLSPVLELKRATPLEAERTPGSSPAPSPMGDVNKADEERSRAVQDMTDKVVRLLRKTRLQVRVIVEVLHCKNPRHLITEVIDLVNPTLVVIGSRGRSALKGVILGSFSNYLVTKSSVPVMVARKRLRKQSKYKQKVVRQINNLNSPAARSLANAKID
ncbi:hypothetical protein RJ55_05497 [Drechmeria coniospora]|nr:hypothetical protein RJ55_05497 [Drechmeria coniospora]